MIFRSTRWKRYRSFLREHLAAIVATIIGLTAIGFVSGLITYKIFRQPLPQLTSEKLNIEPQDNEKYTNEIGDLYE